MDMYSRLPNLVIGFHGCNEEVFNAVVRQMLWHVKVRQEPD